MIRWEAVGFAVAELTNGQIQKKNTHRFGCLSVIDFIITEGHFLF